MKQLLLTTLAFIMLSAATSAQNPVICRLGFAYDLSRSLNWGKGKPVVTKIYPYSPAERAGIKLFDVIDAIEGVSTTDMTPPELTAMMNPDGKTEVSLLISNLSESGKTVIVPKDCKRTDAISEDQLAVAFSMYSPENTSERVFVCPFKTGITADTVNFNRFTYFAFAPVDEANARIETAINAALEKEFKKKGLSYRAYDPDVLIETFYSYGKNPNFRKSGIAAKSRQLVYRYDFSLSRMERFPFLEQGVPESEAEYLLQLGVRMIDKRVKPGRILWEAEANELLSAPYRLETYAQSHIPLMCMQYPYVKYTRNVQFLVSMKSFNYTGISYDINNLATVMSVDLNSPAHAAGIRIRDIIEKIDNQSMEHTAEEFTAAYKQFIANTMPLRDESTVFTDANGFKQCMQWDKMKYVQVLDAMQNPYNMTAFAYLYKFAPYMSPTGTNSCTFVIRRGRNRSEALIRPAIHTETTVEIK
ncbi:MAG: DUF4136 domain-containing protein [Tannerellaceae bacterium]|jgi:hypothetical protein|nr:DUF4136 domain-containing protein [Tannerellaceae bacterium]